jgi:hypothetical protein
MLFKKPGGLVWAAALLGGISGLAVASSRASACECAGDQWQLVRASVTSSDSAAASHERYWPLEGTLSAYPGHAHVWFALSAPETIHYVTSP